MKQPWEEDAYEDGSLICQLNWKNKKEYVYLITPKGFTRRKKKDAKGILRWYDAPQKCMYLGSNPIHWLTSPNPSLIKISFPEMYTFPITDDGMPDVPRSDLMKMMSQGAREAFYTGPELKVIEAYLNTSKYYDRKYTLCRERYENIGRSLYNTRDQKPGSLKEIKWTGLLKDWFVYYVKHTDGSTGRISAKEFNFTD